MAICMANWTEQSEAVIMSTHSSNVPLLIMSCSSKYFKYEHLIQQINLLSQYFKQAISRTFAEYLLDSIQTLDTGGINILDKTRVQKFNKANSGRTTPTNLCWL